MFSSGIVLFRTFIATNLFICDNGRSCQYRIGTGLQEKMCHFVEHLCFILKSQQHDTKCSMLVTCHQNFQLRHNYITTMISTNTNLSSPPCSIILALNHLYLSWVHQREGEQKFRFKLYHRNIVSLYWHGCNVHLFNFILSYLFKSWSHWMKNIDLYALLSHKITYN